MFITLLPQTSYKFEPSFLAQFSQSQFLQAKNASNPFNNNQLQKLAQNPQTQFHPCIYFVQFRKFDNFLNLLTTKRYSLLKSIQNRCWANPISNFSTVLGYYGWFFSQKFVKFGYSIILLLQRGF